MTETEIPQYDKPWRYEYEDLQRKRLIEIREELHKLFQSPSVDGRHISRLLYEERTNAEELINTEKKKRLNLFTNILQPNLHSVHSVDIDRPGYIKDDHEETTLFTYTHNNNPTHFGCALTFRTEITGCTSEKIEIFQVKKGRTIEELVQRIQEQGAKKQSYDIDPFSNFQKYTENNRSIMVLDRYKSGFNYVHYSGRDSKEYIALKTPLLEETQEKGISLKRRDFSKNNFRV